MSSTAGLRPAASYHAIVGQVLAATRQQRELSQADVADAVGVTQSTWSRLERGQQILGLGQLRAASQFLGVQPYEVLEQAEVAVEHCRAEGVEVTSGVLKTSAPPRAMAGNGDMDAALIAIGIGALALLVLAAMSD